MAKKYRSRRGREKIYERVFYAILAVAAVALVVVLVMTMLPQSSAGYTIAADGSVLDASGAYVGTFDELLADGRLVISSDGHIHDQQGNHVTDLTTLLGGTTETTDGGAVVALPEETADTPAEGTDTPVEGTDTPAEEGTDTPAEGTEE